MRRSVRIMLIRGGEGSPGIRILDEGGDALVAVPRRRCAVIAAAVFTLAAVAGLLTLFFRLQPTAISLAESRARVLATNALNDAIAAIMDQNISYDDLMQVSYDATGRVSMLKANTMRMNELGSRIVLKAQRNLEQVAAQSIRIPPAQDTVNTPSCSESKFSRRRPFRSEQSSAAAPSMPTSSSTVNTASMGGWGRSSSASTARIMATAMQLSPPRDVLSAHTH